MRKSETCDERRNHPRVKGVECRRLKMEQDSRRERRLNKLRAQYALKKEVIQDHSTVYYADSVSVSDKK